MPIPMGITSRLVVITSPLEVEPTFRQTRLTISTVIAVLLTSSCSTPPWREFSASSSPATHGATSDSAAPVVTWARDAHTGDLAPLLAPLASKHGIPGVAAAVLRGDRLIAEGVSGVRRIGSDVPVELGDEFEIASGAKAMSATVIALLVEQGKLNWDTPVSDYFPGETIHPDWKNVTLRHLLTHTAGVRDPLLTFVLSAYRDGGSETERRRRFIEKVLQSGLHARPGVDFVYCNTDYILAGAIAEKVTGQSWEQLMRELVFAPLDLRTAGFGPPGEPGEVVQPWGHGKFRVFQLGLFGDFPFDPGARTADYPAIASPAGYVHLSVDDWSKFVSLHLRADRSNPNRTTGMPHGEVYSALHDTLPGQEYAAGWFVGQRPWAKGARSTDTGRVLFHVGNNGRWTSAVWLAPEIDFAVLITCNRGDQMAGVDEIAGALVGAYAHAR